jgi:hypothetical protein
VCVIEMDDLLGHEPLSATSQERVETFYAEAHAAALRLLGGRLSRWQSKMPGSSLRQSNSLIGNSRSKDLVFQRY